MLVPKFFVRQNACGFKRIMGNFNLKFEKQNNDTASLMDLWLANDNVVKYAMFDSSFTDELQYYRSCTNSPDVTEVALLAVWDGNKLVGYVVLHVFCDDGKHGCTINPIVVNPQFANKGYGTEIVRKVLTTAHRNNVGYVEAVVDNDNASAHKLFCHLGFAVNGKHDGFVNYRKTTA